ncbi:TAT-variant-translocated molybdopterin oxidoreductase [Winogradskyella eckloniae]|uniref:TAT-variant-translocated molybdopterin oxidoreductase n=1 Tax=Winogradskyella eckloniae TaxID=1089306 RepID=UPI001564E3CC|nr:TAT-variant-translocated molybdopterin oxidoreductase [Winogradskyella eckloniae]NRD18961.1 TAT-variant-translocated molybdopterin oxidoreductase [Winogradskyella eckloniae]
MSSNKKYWKSVEELNENSSIVEALQQNEFVEEIPTDEFLGDKESLESSSTSRRDFLKYVGFSTAAASLAACEGPVIKSIPYIVQPTEIIPGVANYYATTIANGFDFTSVLVKTREGRPIKIENNTDAATNGMANARVNASVLGLYDNLRVKAPMKGESTISWATFMSETSATLKGLNGKAIVLLTQSMPSPSTNKLIAEFKAKYTNVKHVAYDAISESATLDAYQARYGKRGMADYDFSKARTIVSIGADFLGDWQGGGFESGYATKRIPDHGKMSRHIQFESNMSLTGANADKRIPLTPSEQKLVLAKLYSEVTGNSAVGVKLSEGLNSAVKAAAKEIKLAGRNAVVVTGIQDVNAQTTVLEINAYLRSVAFKPGTTINTRQGSDKAVTKLIADMKAGNVGAIIMNGVNPVYTLPNATEFKDGLAKTKLSVAFSMKQDETSSLCQYIAAAPHNLESWGDFELKTGHYSMMQPTIRPLFNTKQFQEVLMSWTDVSGSYRDYLKSVWTKSILNGASFNKAVQDGVFVTHLNGSGSNGTASVETTTSTKLKDKKDRTFLGGVIHDVAVGVGIKDEDKDEYVTTTTSKTVSNASGTDVSSVLAVGAAVKALANTKVSGGLELSLYTKTGMGDGQQANNPWLQEFPDPITRTTWDNYLTISQADADNLKLKNWNVANGGLNGSYAKVSVNGAEAVTVPVLIQPGQAKGSVGMSFGFGRTSKALKEEMKTGVNAYPLYQNFNTIQSVTIEKAAGEHEFACVQLHNTLMGRGDIIKETTLEVFNTKDKKYWNAVPEVSLNHIATPVTSPDVDLWDEFDRSVGHHFNLSIDLNACTGCGACVIACHAENNVPVVGKSEMRRSRDMHWLRIDRYYSHQDTFEADDAKKDGFNGLFGDTGSLGGFGEMESPADNPQVAFQPVMCQHCNHAPCETVCPVAATAHGRQGQNHMAYNRCVGTRYCANNCPYKVRRFNWFLYNKNDEFDYFMNDDLGRMVLNPDVTVRSRGVMEKCSMCIQKTQKTILDAKRDGRLVKDGEFQTACSAACGNGAMIFGDVNDKDSKIAALKEDDRMYHLLEHVGTKPNVIYQTKVRNTSKA